MHVSQRHRQAWAWLLVVLLSGSASGALFARVWAGASGCAAIGHTCCCRHTGLARCACAGHDGAAAQLASLSRCASERPGFLLTPPPGLLAPPATGMRLACPVGTAPVAAFPPPLSLTAPPPTPPPQAV